MKQTWEELHEEYSNEQYPPFGGPFTDALTPWEWLSKYFEVPVRKGDETDYLLSTEANKKRLDESIKQLDNLTKKQKK